MKQFLLTLFLGKPCKGEPIKYFDREKIKATAVPYNVSYDTWQQAVQQFGYTMTINFFKQLYK